MMVTSTSFLRRRIESAMMQDPSADRICSLNRLLSVMSAAYGGMITLRNRCYDRGMLPVDRVACKVVSVGNIVAGGTGKTPMTAYVARRLSEMGKRVAVVSRGYGGTAVQTGGLASDGKEILMSSETCGDEPYMLSLQLPGIPVLVGRNRYKSGLEALNRFGTQVVVLDDGFQHRRLHRDADLVLLDAGRPFGNSCLLPRGPLREPPEALCRSSAVILTGTENSFQAKQPFHLIERFLSDARVPIYRAVKIPRVCRWVVKAGGGGKVPKNGRDDFLGARVFAFSGIADNHAFLDSVVGLKGRLVGSVGFCDHHRYRAEQVESIFEQARQCGADIVATTEKDHARMAEHATFPLDLAVVGLEMSLGDQTAAFDAFLRERTRG